MFTIRSIVEPDFPRIVEILNVDRHEAMMLEEFVRQERARPQDDPRLQLAVCTPQGAIAGYGESRTGAGQKEGHLFTWVTVAPEYRRRGAGAAAYAALETWAVSQDGARVLESVVKERDIGSQLWAERRGYAQHHHMFQSRLQLDTWDAEKFAGAVRSVMASGIRFSTLAAELANGEETLKRYYDFRFGLGRDIPDVAGRVLPPFAHWRESISANPHWDPAGVILAIDGARWVAVSHLTRVANGGMHNAFTGVDREYRGRGLALAVKVVALGYARRLASPWVTTSNHSVNAPMVAVNTKLGYIPYDGVIMLRKVISVGAGNGV